MRKNNKKGFTIVELVIVIAVIAILAGVLIPTFASIISKANASKALQEAQNAIKVVAADYAENGEAMPNATVYYFENDAANGGKLAYTISYTGGKVEEAVATSSTFAYTDGDCFAKTAIQFVPDNTETTEVNEEVKATVITDIASNIIVVVDAE